MSNETTAPAAVTNEESTEDEVAEVNGKSYPSLQEAIDNAPRNATVKLLADTKENVTISTPYVTLDLNSYTLNGSTGERKPALTVTARVTVMDSSEAQMGTIKREDTAENSHASSHYVIDIQGSGWLTFESGNVTNGSGNTEGEGASLVRVGDDSVAKFPGLNIKGGTFTQNNFIVIKVDRGDLFLNGGTLNSTGSYAIEDWHRATIKGGTVNGAVAAWTYSGGHNSDLTISGGTVNGDVESVTYDGAEGKTAKVSITGGTVNGTLSAKKYNSTENNDPTKAMIEVTGGTFSTDPSPYLVEGSAATPNADGTTYGVAKAYLAKVGETSYYTMDEAFKAQTASGAAITLLRDYTTGSTFSSGSVARVVDLNGHTWTCTGTDASSAAFEINYSNASLTVKNGKVVSSQLVGLIPSAMGGTIKYDNSTLTFENVDASTTATSGIETNGNNTNDAVVLKNSTLNVPNGFGIYFPSSGTLTIDNSTINAKTMGVQVCSGSLNVNAGSKITASGDPVEKTEGDGAIQDGAAISVVNRPGYKGLDQVAIIGGTFTAKGDNAAIKVYTWDSSTKQEEAFNNSAKTVAISGGTFSSAVPEALCADGCIPAKQPDGTYSVKEGKFVADVGNIGYETFDEAIAAANASTEDATITLRENITIGHQLVIENAKNKLITLDLKGFTLTSTYAINKANKNGSYALVNNTPLTIKNGTFAAGQARAIGALATLTLDGATVTQTLTGGHACVAFCANGKSYTIKNSTINGAYAVCNFANNATVNITGSTLTGTGNTLYHNGSNYGLKLTVKDTTITSSGSCGVYISGSTSAQSNADNQNGAGGYQKAAFTGCTISGAINGVEVKYADLTLDGCTVSTTAKDGSYKQDNNGPAGSGFAVVSTDNAMNNVTPKPEGTIIIKGEGRYTGPVGLGSLESVKETYKDFADETIKVSDGTFTVAVPEAYCAAGYTPTANADGTYGVKLAEGAYMLQSYRSGDQAAWTYPSKEGMAFAGWYKDAGCKTPCTSSDVEGAAYAKFVKIADLLQFKGGSLRMDVGDPTASTYLRFGYTMAIPDKTTYVENGWYYKKVTVSSPNDVRFVAYNNVLNSDGTITSNLVFKGVKANLYKASFNEKAFVKYQTADGTTVEAVESEYWSRSVDEVADAILQHPMASQKEKQYARGIKSVNQ